MGLFWDLIQQSQISDQKQRTSSLDERVARLEGDLRSTQRLVRQLLEVLEKRFGEDIDGDGRVG